MSFLKSLGNVLKAPADVFGGALAGLGNVAGSLISANATNKATNKQLNWERERATNAHQWEVQDLKDAGLNPILSANAGATTGGISAPIPDTSGISNAGTALMEALRTKTETAKNGAETANIIADTQNKHVQKLNIEADTLLKEHKQGLISAKETWTRLKNKSEKIRAENAELDFWNNQINTAAKSLNLLAGTGTQAVKGFLKEAKDGKWSKGIDLSNFK